MTTFAEIVRLHGLTAAQRAFEKNEKSRAWLAEDPKNRSVGLLSEDQSYWALHHVHTGYDLERRMALETYSDVYKEQHGFRPTMVEVRDLPLPDLEIRIQNLQPDEVTRTKQLRREFRDVRDAAKYAGFSGDNEAFKRFVIDVHGWEPTTAQEWVSAAWDVLYEVRAATRKAV